MKDNITTPEVLTTVPSMSDPTKSYEIRRGKDGVIYCTCMAWIRKKTCKHLEAYQKQNEDIIYGR